MIYQPMVEKIVHPHPLNARIAYLILILGFLHISNLALAQHTKKTLWIIFDPGDSLCVDMGDPAFRFYRYNKQFPYKDFAAPRETVKYDTLCRLPRNKQIVNRQELFELLDKLPKEANKNSRFYYNSEDGWYNNAFSVIYIVIKRESYYLRCKVEKVGIFN